MLDTELKGKNRVHLKSLEYEIQQFEDDLMEFANCIVKRMDKYDVDNNLTAYGEENLGCQSGDNDGKKLNFGLDKQNFIYKPYFII